MLKISRLICFCLVFQAVIGVTLEIALERNPSHDGVPLPAFVRYLIDFIEEYGLAVEGIYRVNFLTCLTDLIS